MDFLHQYSRRHPGLHSGHAPDRRSAVDQGRSIAPAQHGLHGPGVPDPCDGRPANHAGQGRRRRLVLVAVHLHLRCAVRRRYHRSLCVGVAAERSADQFAALPLQKLCHLLLSHDAGGRRAERQHRAPAAVHAATAGLHGDHGGPGAHRRGRDAALHDAAGRLCHGKNLRALPGGLRFPDAGDHFQIRGRRHQFTDELC